MRRHERRKLEKEVHRLLKADGDNCTSCRRAFMHGDRTYLGSGPGKHAAVLGDCCANQLVYELGRGLFSTRSYDVFSEAHGNRAESLAPEALSKAVANFRSLMAVADAAADDVSRRAGVSGRGSISLRDSPWKSDDASWFKSHPDRSHRLRALLIGELETLPDGCHHQIMPPGHALSAIVRQVEPGKRVRKYFARNLEWPIADSEAVLHALFDIVSRPDSGGRVISPEELSTLAKLYSRASTS